MYSFLCKNPTTTIECIHFSVRIQQLPEKVLISKDTISLNFQQLLTLRYQSGESGHFSFLQNVFSVRCLLILNAFYNNRWSISLLLPSSGRYKNSHCCFSNVVCIVWQKQSASFLHNCATNINICLGSCVKWVLQCHVTLITALTQPYMYIWERFNKYFWYFPVYP